MRLMERAALPMYVGPTVRPRGSTIITTSACVSFGGWPRAAANGRGGGGEK